MENVEYRLEDGWWRLDRFDYERGVAILSKDGERRMALIGDERRKYFPCHALIADFDRAAEQKRRNER